MLAIGPSSSKPFCPVDLSKAISSSLANSSLVLDCRLVDFWEGYCGVARGEAIVSLKINYHQRILIVV